MNSTSEGRLNEDDRDWRIEAVTPLASPVLPAYQGGPSFDKGDAVYLTCGGKHKVAGSLFFIAPSPVAMALNIAMRTAGEALQKSHALNLEYTPAPGGPGKMVNLNSIPKLYDYFEHCMITVIFSFQAVEAFANQEMVNSGVSEIKIKRKKKMETFSPREAERKLSTLEKIGTVLPDIFKVPSPKGKAVWQRFRDLQKVRNAVVHLKNQIIMSSETPDERYVLFHMLDSQIFQYPESAYSIIEYFFQSRELPHWAKLFRQKNIEYNKPGGGDGKKLGGFT